MTKEKNSELIFAGLFVFLAIVFFGRLFIPGQMISGDDSISLSYPMLKFYYETSAHWCPLVLGGFPYDVFNVPFSYPPILLCKALGPTLGLAILIVLHFFLAAGGTYLFLKRYGLSPWACFIAAASYSCGSVFIGSVGQFPFIFIMALAPWIFLGLEIALSGRFLFGSLIFGVVAGLMLTQLHYQLVFYFFFLALFYAVIRIRTLQTKLKLIIRPMVLALIIMLVMAGPQLYRVLEMKESTTRGQAMSYEESSWGSLPQEEMFAFYIPAAFGDWTNGRNFFPKINSSTPYYWGRMAIRLNIDHVGMIALILALAAILFRKETPGTLPWSLILLLFVTLFLGAHFFTYFLAYKLIPGFSFFRAPYRFIYPSALLLAIVAAHGFESLLRSTPEELKRIRKYLVALPIGLLALATIFIIGVMSGFFLPAQLESGFNVPGLLKVMPPDWAPMIQNSPFVKFQGLGEIIDYWFKASFYTIIFSIAALVCIWKATTRTAESISLRHPLGILAIFFVLEISIISAGYIKTIPINNEFYVADPITQILEAESKKGPEFRVLSLVESNFKIWLPNKGMLFNIETISGYQATIQSSYLDIMQNVMGDSALRDFLNVKFIIAPANAAIQGWDRVGIDPARGISLWKNPKVLPRVSFVTNAISFMTSSSRMAYLTSPEFDPRREVILDKPLSRTSPVALGMGAHAKLKWQYGSDTLEVDVETPTDGYLVVADCLHPRWKVYINGKEEKIISANHAFRAVKIAAGHAKVTFEFKDRVLNILSIMSLVAFLASALAIFVTRSAQKTN